MLTKATIETFQGLVYLSHNIFILIPIKFSSKFLHLQNNSKITKMVIKFIWPPILQISLAMTVFEFSYFCIADSQINLVIFLYHGTLLVTKSAAIIVQSSFSKAGLQFCQLFNAIITISVKKRATLLDLCTTAKSNNDDFLFSLLLATCSVFLVIFYSLFLPIISFLLPCLHKTPISAWVGNCNSSTVRALTFLINLIFMLPLGLLGALLVFTSCAAIKCIFNRLSGME